MYIDKPSLTRALSALYGTAGHLLKIWFTLKHMGLGTQTDGIEIDTTNSTPSLKKLFSCGASDNRFYIPFAHTPRYLCMKHDASRSIIQTTIQRWATSGSVVTCDPTEFLDINLTLGNKLLVQLGRKYPFGLGIDESGFALADGKRVSIPLTSFSIWYGRTTLIPSEQEPLEFLRENMLNELNITPSERELIFLEDSATVSTQPNALTDAELFDACSGFIEGREEQCAEVYHETFEQYTRKIKSMISGLDNPKWMRTSPANDVKLLIEEGAKALLLYGPPRTGKTRLIDLIIPRNSNTRCTIQIHDGWGYDNLIQGLKPDTNGNWCWENGPLKTAIQNGKKFIVLEEINRTSISQALGEVFSLIEDAYRGENNAITLRNGEKFSIDEDVIFIMTMNTVDKSTEDVDDALIGRVAAVELPPRAEDLSEMLSLNKVPTDTRQKICELFAEIQLIYPLGHGYFSGLNSSTNDDKFIRYYKARIRPVLTNFMGELKAAEMAKIDNIVDDMFGS